LATRKEGILVLRTHKPTQQHGDDAADAEAAPGTSAPPPQAALTSSWGGMAVPVPPPGFGFTLEGPLCDEYFAVRAVLYGLYTTV
jgi:hypothetical protein